MVIVKAGWLIAAGVAALALLGVKKKDGDGAPVTIGGVGMTEQPPTPQAISGGFGSAHTTGGKPFSGGDVKRAAFADKRLQEAYNGQNPNAMVAAERQVAGAQLGIQNAWAHYKRGHIKGETKAAFEAALAKLEASRPTSVKAVIAKGRKKAGN